MKKTMKQVGKSAVNVLALALIPAVTMAASPKADQALAAQLQQLMERVQQLDQRNQALERRVQELSQAQSLAGANTPAVVSGNTANVQRLQAVEQRQQALQQQVQALARVPDANNDAADAGPKVEATLVAAFQHVNAHGTTTGASQGRMNYRGDVLVTLPAGAVGAAQATAVGQLRFGQGTGLGLRTLHTGAVNSTSFESGGGSQETYAILAQGYYQLEWPLDAGRFNDQASSRVQLNVGKMDVFGFFDQNAVAGDESSAFMNNVFVHNPLLDSGGDIAADDYGFAPGARVAWRNEGEKWAWGLSMGAFASGTGATLNAGAGKPLVIAQFELSPKQINGEPRGTYRAYTWTNGRTKDLSDAQQKHSGVGLSLDQRVGRELNVFARWGKLTSGEGKFNKAITLGFEHGGRAWGRGHDAVGLAWGRLKTSDVWRDTTVADNSLVNYAATANERLTELYYRYKVNDKLALTPSVQFIQSPGGNLAAPMVRIMGLRATLGF